MRHRLNHNSKCEGQRGNVMRDMERDAPPVVGGLALVDVVVRMDEFGAEGSAEQLDGAVGNNFVDVHVCLSAGARLPHHQGEMV